MGPREGAAGDSGWKIKPEKIKGVWRPQAFLTVTLSLLQGIFPTQGSSQGLPHCRQMLYHLSNQGSPFMANRWGKNGNSDRLYFLRLQNHYRW